METLPLYTIKKNPSDVIKTKVTSSIDSYRVALQLYGDDLEVYESFHIILLNQAMETIGVAKISQGGITTTTVDVRLIAKYVIDSLATSIILVHNHPSGNLKTSSSDIEITKQIIKAMDIFNVRVPDHLILTASGYYSFADNGDI